MAISNLIIYLFTFCRFFTFWELATSKKVNKKKKLHTFKKLESNDYSDKILGNGARSRSIPGTHQGD